MAIVFMGHTPLTYAGEIFCLSKANSIWDRLSDRNKKLVRKSQCVHAEYAGKITTGDSSKIKRFLNENVVVYLNPTVA